jgi:photosystem II stability/assembly factor-like uncharacterized protein
METSWLGLRRLILVLWLGSLAPACAAGPRALFDQDASVDAQTSPSAGHSLHALWASAGNDVWAVGDLGTIVHYDGRRWNPSESGTTAALTIVYGAGSRDVWAVGQGRVLHWNGTAWNT